MEKTIETMLLIASILTVLFGIMLWGGGFLMWDRAQPDEFNPAWICFGSGTLLLAIGGRYLAKRFL